MSRPPIRTRKSGSHRGQRYPIRSRNIRDPRPQYGIPEFKIHGSYPPWVRKRLRQRYNELAYKMREAKEMEKGGANTDAIWKMYHDEITSLGKRKKAGLLDSKWTSITGLSGKDTFYLLAQEGKIKSPIKSDSDFRRFLKKHGFRDDEMIEFQIKGGGPKHTLGGATDHSIQFSLSAIELEGELTEESILHEMGHVLDKKRPSLGMAWRNEFSDRVEEIREGAYNPYLPEWTDLGEWEFAEILGSGGFDRNEEWLAKQYADYHTGKLQSQIDGLEGQLEPTQRSLKRLGEKYDKLSDKRTKDAKDLKKSIKAREDAIREVSKMVDLNEDAIEFWERNL